ncbi:MAG: flagellar filament capping protein FliD [Poseidonibacter sp.]
MADGILGLGSSQSLSLDQDLIDKLKTAERAATVEPIETEIEDIATENEVFATIDDKVSELLDSVKTFDLFVTGGATAFDQKTATAAGTSVTFDAADVSALNTGITTVEVIALAQKDAYQSNSVSEANKDLAINAGDLEITINGTTTTFDTTDKTYEELTEEINSTAGVYASLEQVGTDSYRLVLKSSESGVDNSLTISGDAAADDKLGFNNAIDSITGSSNHILTAQDMEATVDGVSYSISTNSLEVDGIKITATEIGTSSINITADNTSIETSMNEFISKYNELVSIIEEEVYSTDSYIEDKSALRDILTQIKDKLFGTYGSDSDKSVFNYGFELDSYGVLTLDSTVFNSALDEDPDLMKSIFVGTAENEGIGTQIKALIDSMSFTDGVLGLYESSLESREETLNEELEEAEETLDDKYTQLSAQFAAYTTIITSFETAFSSLELLIAQSTSSS